MLVPGLTWVYVLGGTALHAGIWTAQGVKFGQFIVLYIVFIEALRRNWRDWRRRRPITGAAQRWIILYDGACPRCLRTMLVLDWLDSGRRLQYIDLEHEWPRAAALLPALSQNAAREAMHVVGPDGSLDRGFHAFRTLANALRVTWPVRPLLRTSLARTLGERLYRRIARGRSRFCTMETCGL